MRSFGHVTKVSRHRAIDSAGARILHDGRAVTALPRKSPGRFLGVPLARIGGAEDPPGLSNSQHNDNAPAPRWVFRQLVGASDVRERDSFSDLESCPARCKRSGQIPYRFQLGFL